MSNARPSRTDDRARWKLAWRRADSFLARHALVTDAVIVAPVWTVAAIKDTTFAYELAGALSLRFLIDAARLIARTAGAPEWRPDEAYLATLRRSRLASRRTD